MTGKPSCDNRLNLRTGGHIKSYLSLASISVRTLEYTTADVASTWLLPEMVLRVANMLNYFLQFLTGIAASSLHVAAACLRGVVACTLVDVGLCVAACMCVSKVKLNLMHLCMNHLDSTVSCFLVRCNILL